MKPARNAFMSEIVKNSFDTLVKSITFYLSMRIDELSTKSQTLIGAKVKADKEQIIINLVNSNTINEDLYAIEIVAREFDIFYRSPAFIPTKEPTSLVISFVQTADSILNFFVSNNAKDTFS